MEKGKNRTDLLAAGRKKLQQFRQKKDHRTSSSSSSHGKPSHKTSNPDIAGHVEVVPPGSSADAEPAKASETIPAFDADVTSHDDPAVLPVTPMLVTLAHGAAGASVVSEPVISDSEISTSLGESNGGTQEQKGSGDPPNQPPGNRGTMSNKVSDQDADHSSLDQCNGSSIDGGKSSGLKTPEMENGMDEPHESMALAPEDRVREGAMTCLSPEPEGSHEVDGLPLSAEETHQVDGDNSACERVGADEIRVDTSAVDSLGTSTAQEVDGFSVPAEDTHERYGNLGASPASMEIGVFGTESKMGEQPFASGDDMMEEHSMKEDADAYVVPGSVGAQEADAFCVPSEAVHEATSYVSCEHGDGICPGQSLEIMSQAQGVSDPEREEDVALADANGEQKVDRAEGEKEDLHGFAFTNVSGDIGELPDGDTISLRKNLEMHLPEETVSFLLNVGDSVSAVGLLDTENRVLSQSGFDDGLESFKRHLYLTNVTKDFLQLQLIEQTDSQVELDLHLSDEVSRLWDLVKVTQESSATVHEELAQCRSELQAMFSSKEELEIQYSSSRKEVKELSARACQLQSRLELSQEESVKLSSELADCKGILGALQVENSKLTARIISGREEMKKLEADKEYLANENIKLVSGLSEQQERLVLSLDKQVQFEADLKETMTFLEKLTEDNICLSSSLDIHRSKVKEFDDKHQELLRHQAQEFGNHEGSNVQNLVGDDVIGGRHQAIHDNSDREVLAGTSAKSVTPCPGQNLLLQQDEEKGFGELGALHVFKGYLEEAEKIMQNLEKAIQGMHSHSMSLGRLGGRVTASGVSKLIRAFESKAHQDDTASEEVPLIEGEKSSDSDLFALTKEHICNLRAALNHMDKEVTEVFFMEDKDSKRRARELEVECEIQKLQNNNLERKIDAVVMKLTEYKSAIDDLQCQWDNTRQDANDMARGLLNQVESLENEMKDKATALQRERDSIRDAVSMAIQKLDSSTGLLVSGNLDVGSHVTASVNAALEVIEDSHKKLEAAYLDRDRSCASYEELCKNYTDMHGSQESAIGILNRIHSSLSELVNDSCESAEKTVMDVKAEESLQHLPENFEILLEQLKKLLDERLLLHSAKGDLESEVLHRSQEMEQLQERCIILAKSSEDNHSVIEELRSLSIRKGQDIEELNRRCLALVQKLDDHEISKSTEGILEVGGNVEGPAESDKMEIDSVKLPLLRVEASVALLLQKYEEAIEQVNLSKNYICEVIPQSELLGDNLLNPLHILLRQVIVAKVMELNELQEKVNWLSYSNRQHENDMEILKVSLSKMEEALEMGRSELLAKVTELEQSEQRLSSVREKLSIAVAKGKGLIVQRDSLKHSLMEKSSELDKCLQDLRSKESMLHELEAKLKSYSEADRVEALESELSYIRNSATALRDSFLLKDSILQRIEEVMEDLDLPEHFHSKDIIEKVEWLARYVAGNSSFPLTDWDQKSSMGGSHSDAGILALDAWKDELQPNSIPGFDDMKRKYEELQNKFYSLAEQNDMLEQSLMERNNLVQSWEEVLDKIDMPLQLRSMETEDRIEWLGTTLSEVQQERDSLLLKIDNLEISTDSLLADLKVSHKRASELDAMLITIKHENEFLSESLDRLRSEHLEFSEKAVQDELDKDSLQKEIADLQEKLVKKLENKEYHSIVSEMTKLQDLVGEVLPDHYKVEITSSDSSAKCLEGLLTKLIENYKTLSLEKSVSRESEDCTTDKNNLMIESEDCTTDKNDLMIEEQKLEVLLNDKERELVALRIELDKVSHNLVVAEEERDATAEKYCSQVSGTEAIVKQRDALQVERDATMENYQSFVSELEAVSKQRDALQDQLNQEEQRSASMREKLNVAVRKGKGLVQQRDSLKQTVEEMNTEVERLKSELDNRVEALRSENMLLRDSLAETEHGLEDSSQTLNGLLTALHAVDLGGEANIVDPVQKMEVIGKLSCDLRAAALSFEQEAIKSKRAAELLLAELNEVQERADSLQEDLEKAEAGLAECSREKDVAEAAKMDALSHLQQFMMVQSEERKKQLGSAVQLRDGIAELRKGCLLFSNLLTDVFSRDIDLFGNVQTSMEAMLKQMDGTNSDDLPLIASRDLLFGSLVSEEKCLEIGTLSEINTPKDFDDNLIMEHLNLAGHNLHECFKELSDLKKKVQKHSFVVDKQVKHLFTILETIQSRLSSEKLSSESLKRDITHLGVMNKKMESEMSSMHRNITLLYEVCHSSILELESRKAQMIGKVSASEVHAFGKSGMVFNPPSCMDEPDTPSFTEDCIRKMADSLLSTVKGSGDIQEEIVEGNQRELKTTILDLQRELQEKDIQQNQICAELVSQIREAEAIAKKYLIDLDSAKTQLHSLDDQIKGMEKDHKLLELRESEIKNWEASSKELEERIRSLSDSLTAKDQEIDVLMQALDEEESQMESLQNRNQELEKIVQQNNVVLESLEVSRAKAVAKLSTTLNRFDELHHLSENLLAEIENLQSQLQGRDSEISFLRQEVTRCTNDVLAEQESNKKNLIELHELQTWMHMMVSRFGEQDMHIDDENCSRTQSHIKFIDKQIASVIAELDDLQVTAQNKDALLEIERGRVNELSRKAETLETCLRDKESQISSFGDARDPGQPSTLNSPESLEVEPLINKRSTLGPVATHVRSGRKINSDQVAIAIDLEQNNNTLDDEDDDKAHGFKSLTMSRIVPRASRPIADRIDGLWVSIERLLMRQPTLRLGLIMYWVALHVLLAATI